MPAYPIDHFLKHLAAQKNYSQNTILAYQNDLEQFMTLVGDEIVWKNLDSTLVRKYIRTLQSKGYASSTVARKVAAVKSFLSYLQESGSITEDIAGQIATPKVQRRAQTLLTREQVRRLLDVPNGSRGPKSLRNRALLNLLYLTDLRITELVGLKLHHFDGQNLLGIPLPNAMIVYLNDYVEKGRPAMIKNEAETALFLNHRGSMLTRQGLWLIIKDCATKAGLTVPVTPQTLHRSLDAHKGQEPPQPSLLQNP
jgi:integrase/recombinase XerD